MAELGTGAILRHRLLAEHVLPTLKGTTDGLFVAFCGRRHHYRHHARNNILMTHCTYVNLLVTNVVNVCLGQPRVYRHRTCVLLCGTEPCSTVLIVLVLTVASKNFKPEILVENMNYTCKVYVERKLFLC